MNLAGSQWRRYGLWYLVSLLVLMGAVALINAVVDPLGRLLIVDRDGFNQTKIAIEWDSRSGKALALRQCEFDGVILGTSRSETGLQPSSPALADKRVFNAALKGTSFYETQRMAHYMLQQSKPEFVVIGVDFIAFSSNRYTGDDFDQSPLADEISLPDLGRYLVSARTLRQSFFTVNWNRKRVMAPCEDNGAQRKQLTVLPRETFRQVLVRYVTNTSLYAGGELSHERFQQLDGTLRELLEGGIKVYLLISPLHAINLEAMTALGRRDEFDEWKRQLVKIVQRINRDLGGQRLLLWDFSGYNSITTEPFPSTEPAAFMRWYRDSAHYSPAAGNLVLARVMGTNTASERVPDDFGVLLNDLDLDDYLAAQRAGEIEFRKTNSEQIGLLKRILAENPRAD